MGLSAWIRAGALFVVISGTAQGDKSDTVPYYTDFPNTITIRTGLNLTGNRFLFDYQDEGIDLRFKPVRTRRLTTSVQFRSLELDFGFSPGFLNPDRDLDEARVFSLDFRLFFRRWMPSFTYLDQKGFQTEIEGNEFYFRDFATRKIGGNLAYVFNPNFSFRAIHSQNEWQRRSAGSFVPALIAFYTRFQLQDTDNNQTLHSYALGAGPGYHYNWVIAAHWLLSAGNTTGIGIDILEEAGDTNSYWFWDTKFSLALGYNSKHWFGGVRVNYNYLETDAGKSVRLDDQLYFGEAYLGYRFDAPAGWIRAGDRINRKFGLE